MKYAIIKDGTVQNIAVADEQLAAENGWIAVSEETPVEPGWIYDGANFTEPAPTDDFLKEVNRSKARQLLTETDWTSLPDVADQSAHPHLVNTTDFYSYRNTLRTIAVNPTVQVEWPKRPVEQWSQ